MMLGMCASSAAYRPLCRILRQARRPAAQAHPELLAAVRAGPPDTSQRLRHAAETFERASALVRHAHLLAQGL